MSDSNVTAMFAWKQARAEDQAEAARVRAAQTRDPVDALDAQAAMTLAIRAARLRNERQRAEQAAQAQAVADGLRSGHNQDRRW